jgi:hypothetical protein
VNRRRDIIGGDGPEMALRRLRSHLALLVLAAGGCATGGLDQPDGWAQSHSAHFRMRAGVQMSTRDLLFALEEMYVLLASSVFQARQPATVDVLALPADEYRTAFGLDLSHVALARAPGAGFGAGGLLVISDADHQEPGGLSHLFLQAVAPGAPLWLHEGVARYLATAKGETVGLKRIGCMGQRFLVTATLKQTEMGWESVYQRDLVRVMPLPDLFALSWDAAHRDHELGFRGTARGLIDLLVHGPPAGHPGKLVRLVAEVGGGKPVMDSLLAIEGGATLAEIDGRIRRKEQTIVEALARNQSVRTRCPVGFPLRSDLDSPRGTVDGGVPATEMAPLLQWLRALPGKEVNHPRWYPPEALDRQR